MIVEEGRLIRIAVPCCGAGFSFRFMRMGRVQGIEQVVIWGRRWFVWLYGEKYYDNWEVR